ncbi:hypothetical protein DLAC_04390 [Tieghemostelium lacteum]|uniref:Uncharacterized protein n=1 Tax=Tieghemostelium lacteum TaxID=361077 RepID=A0A151ZJQ0_TIELA|nr:hypothetical protein DLAC_04390 [Tieghemostelium lacteum]|eukprot:KYQ94110.1 hypothetical protein DLAC_04390 [Tieghemostelium lacteum]
MLNNSSKKSELTHSQDSMNDENSNNNINIINNFGNGSQFKDKSKRNSFHFEELKTTHLVSDNLYHSANRNSLPPSQTSSPSHSQFARTLSFVLWQSGQKTNSKRFSQSISNIGNLLPEFTKSMINNSGETEVQQIQQQNSTEVTPSSPYSLHPMQMKATPEITTFNTPYKEKPGKKITTLEELSQDMLENPSGRISSKVLEGLVTQHFNCDTASLDYIMNEFRLCQDKEYWLYSDFLLLLHEYHAIVNPQEKSSEDPNTTEVPEQQEITNNNNSIYSNHSRGSSATTITKRNQSYDEIFSSTNSAGELSKLLPSGSKSNLEIQSTRFNDMMSERSISSSSLTSNNFFANINHHQKEEQPLKLQQLQQQSEQEMVDPKEYDRLKQENDKLKDENYRIQKQNDAMRKTMADYQVDEQNSTSQKKKENKEDLEAASKRLKEEVELAYRAREELKKQLSQMVSSHNQEIRQMKEDHQREIKDIKEESLLACKALTQKNEDLDKSIKNIQSKHNSLFDELSMQLVNNNNIELQLKVQEENFKKEIQSLKKELSSANQKLRDQEADQHVYHHLSTSGSILRQSQQSDQKVFNHTEQQHTSNSGSMIDEYVNTIQSLRDQLTIVEKERDKLHQQYNQLESDINHMQLQHSNSSTIQKNNIISYLYNQISPMFNNISESIDRLNQSIKSSNSNSNNSSISNNISHELDGSLVQIHSLQIEESSLNLNQSNSDISFSDSSNTLEISIQNLNQKWIQLNGDLNRFTHTKAKEISELTDKITQLEKDQLNHIISPQSLATSEQQVIVVHQEKPSTFYSHLMDIFSFLGILFTIFVFLIITLVLVQNNIKLERIS